MGLDNDVVYRGQNKSLNGVFFGVGGVIFICLVHSAVRIATEGLRSSVTFTPKRWRYLEHPQLGLTEIVLGMVMGIP